MSGTNSKSKFPLEITDVEQKINAELKKDFLGHKNGFVQVGTDKWFFPKEFEENLSRFYNLQPRPDDVWIVSYPRTGTTMNQEIVWLLANNLDYEKASRMPVFTRFPFLELGSIIHRDMMDQFLEQNKDSEERMAHLKQITTALQFLENTTERRFIKTHIPLQLLPPSLLEVGCKVVYVARNPKDVAVSFYHLHRDVKLHGYAGDFPKFWKYFQTDMIIDAPYWLHVQKAWQNRNNKNLLFLFYEEETKDLKSHLKKIAEFLEVTYSDHDYATLEEHMKIENFRKNDSVNFKDLRDIGFLNENDAGHVRIGKTGGWKDYFVGDLEKSADKWIEENLNKIDFPGFSA